MVQTRIATDKDLPQILDIYNDAILNTTAVYDYEPHTLDMRRQWFETKQQQGFPVFVAEENNEVLGFSSIGPFRAWAGYKYSVENSIYVKDGQRGKGIGKLLMQPLIDAAKEMKLHTIIAGIDADNKLSIDFHKQFGFEEAGHLKQIGWKFDRWLDLVFMQLLIK
ncbi:N-acetyltransferase [Panacibacter ginsenosidivorans]|uniref:N-acetyltransferase n=1 Tax=Panacibacter ginsenosidivorans TaxID=1813871 RepID=A0A5B8V650_9BACT|nr:GNAT family N-acetyltransferase [Panacibacter ginsenosidivorans]QEC66211.1 N-acetyltransferase [Panacibacter ginsenosidivorans]